jgi:uncharacterized protein (TIGR03437 family)
LVVLQGEGFAPPSQEITGGRGDVRVLFDGAAAAILQLSSKEIVAVVPYGFQGRDWVSVVVESLGQQSSPVRVMMVDANPALFTVNGRGNGQAVAENGDGTANSPTNPVRPGSFLTLFGTGEGVPDRDPGPQGGLVPVEPWLVALPKEPVRVFFGNEEADLVYAGPMPGGSFGKLMMVVPVPRTVTVGEHEVTFEVAGFVSQVDVTVSVG